MIVTQLMWAYYWMVEVEALSLSLRYDLYEYVRAQPARFFLTKRANADGIDQELPIWAEAEDTTGWQDYAGVLANIDRCATIVNVYWALQGIVIILLFVRIILRVNFQRKLGLTLLTMKYSMVDLNNFLFTLFYFLLGSAVVGCILFGARVSRFSTIEDSFEYIFESFLGDHTYSDALDPAYALNSLELFNSHMYRLLMSVGFIFVMLNFVFGILGDAFTEAKEEVMDAPSLVQELLPKIRYYIRRITRGWPSSKETRDMLEMALLRIELENKRLGITNIDDDAASELPDDSDDDDALKNIKLDLQELVTLSTGEHFEMSTLARIVEKTQEFVIEKQARTRAPSLFERSKSILQRSESISTQVDVDRAESQVIRDKFMKKFKRKHDRNLRTEEEESAAEEDIDPVELRAKLRKMIPQQLKKVALAIQTEEEQHKALMLELSNIEDVFAAQIKKAAAVLNSRRDSAASSSDPYADLGSFGFSDAESGFSDTESDNDVDEQGRRRN